MSVHNIDPLQPYFVLNTKFYQKQLLEHSHVAHFYQFSYTEENSVLNCAVPDGTVDIIFDTDSGCATISGSAQSAVDTFFEPGHTYFGARFRPGALEHYGEISAAELVGTSVSLSDVIKHEVFDGIFKHNSFEKRVKAAGDRFCGLFVRNEQAQAPDLVSGLLTYICGQNGNIMMGELEDEFFYSRRHLLRVFKQYMGMDIKSFSRIVRFQSVLCELKKNQDISFTDMAQNYGYYDQTHFQKEFKKFALLTPKQYVKTLLESDYHNRIYQM